MPWIFQALSLLHGNLGQAGCTQQEAPSCTSDACATSRMLMFAPDSIQWKKIWVFCYSISLKGFPNKQQFISLFGLEIHWPTEQFNSFSCTGISASMQVLDFSH